MSKVYHDIRHSSKQSQHLVTGLLNNRLNEHVQPESANHVVKKGVAEHFFESNRFQTLYEHVYNIELLANEKGDTRSNAEQASTCATVSPHALQLLNTSSSDSGATDRTIWLLTGSTADDRRKLLESWRTRTIQVLPSPIVYTPAEWKAQQKQIRQAVGARSAAQFAVNTVSFVMRDMVRQPHKWAMTGVATVFATSSGQDVFVQGLKQHIVPIFVRLHPSDVDTAQRMAHELTIALARQLATFPGTVWSVLGDNRLSASHQGMRIAASIAVPLITNVAMITPVQALLPVIGVSGVLAGLLALVPTETDRVMEGATTSVGQAALTTSLTGGTAVATRLLLHTIPGASFSAGTLQFAIASSLTTHVAQSMVSSMTGGQLLSPQFGPTIFSMMLEEADNHFVFLQFQYRAKEMVRKMSAAAQRMYQATWVKHVAPALPKSVRGLTPHVITGYTVSLALWFVYASLPFHLMALRYECRSWADPLLASLQRLLPWLTGTQGDAMDSSQTPTSLAGLLGWVYGSMHTGMYEQLWQPLLTHILQEKLELPAKAMAGVDEVIRACQKRYPWMEAMLKHKPFATVFRKELLQRWHLDHLLHLSLEHLCIRSPLSTVFSLAFDVRQGTPQKWGKFFTTKLAQPMIESMRAIYDSRVDMYTGVKLTLFHASEAHRSVPPTTTEELMLSMAEASEKIQRTSPTLAYSKLRDAWTEYAQFITQTPNTGSATHPDMNAHTRRMAMYERLTTDFSSSTQTAYFVSECVRLERDLHNQIRLARMRRTQGRANDLEAYRLRFERETKRAYLRDIAYAANIIRYANKHEKHEGVASHFAEWTDTELDEDVQLSDLREMAYAYTDITDTLARWQTMYVKAKQLRSSSKSPLSAEFESCLISTQRYAHRLSNPFTLAQDTDGKQSSSGANSIPRPVVLGIRTFKDDIKTLKRLTSINQQLLKHEQQRVDVLNLYANIFQTILPLDHPPRTSREWAFVETTLHLSTLKGASILDHFRNNPQKGKITVAQLEAKLLSVPSDVRDYTQTLLIKREQFWKQRLAKQHSLVNEYKQVLTDRYKNRNERLTDLKALVDQSIPNHVNSLQTLRDSIDINEARLDWSRTTPSSLYDRSNNEASLKSWFDTNAEIFSDSALQAYRKTSSVIQSIPTDEQLKILQARFVLDQDHEGARVLNKLRPVLTNARRQLHEAHSTVVDVQRAAYWRHAQRQVKTLETNIPLEQSRWWPFHTPRFIQWDPRVVEAHRKIQNEHVERLRKLVTLKHTPLSAAPLDTVDILARGGWINLLDEEHMSAREKASLSDYLRHLQQHERQVRAYIDHAFREQVEDAIQSKRPLDVDLDATMMRRKMKQVLQNIQRVFTTYHAEAEGYVHPIVDNLITHMNVRYDVLKGRQETRQLVDRLLKDFSSPSGSNARSIENAFAELKRLRHAQGASTLNAQTLKPVYEQNALSGRTLSKGNASSNHAHRIDNILKRTVSMEMKQWKDSLSQLDQTLTIAQQVNDLSQKPLNQETVRMLKTLRMKLSSLATNKDGIVLVTPVRNQIDTMLDEMSLHEKLQEFDRDIDDTHSLLEELSNRLSEGDTNHWAKTLYTQMFGDGIDAMLYKLQLQQSSLSTKGKMLENAVRLRAANDPDLRISKLSRAVEQHRKTVIQEAQPVLHLAYHNIVREYTTVDQQSRAQQASVYKRVQQRYRLWRLFVHMDDPNQTTIPLTQDPLFVEAQTKNRLSKSIHDTLAKAPETRSIGALRKYKQLLDRAKENQHLDPELVKQANAAYRTARHAVFEHLHQEYLRKIKVRLISGLVRDEALRNTRHQFHVDHENANTRSLLDKHDELVRYYQTTLPSLWKKWLHQRTVYLNGPRSVDTYNELQIHANGLVQTAPFTIRETVSRAIQKTLPAAPSFERTPTKGTESSPTESEDGPRERPIKHAPEPTPTPKPKSKPEPETKSTPERKPGIKPEAEPNPDIKPKTKSDPPFPELSAIERQWSSLLRRTQPVLPSGYDQSKRAAEQLKRYDDFMSEMRVLHTKYKTLIQRRTKAERSKHPTWAKQEAAMDKKVKEVQQAYTVAEAALIRDIQAINAQWTQSQNTLNKDIRRNHVFAEWLTIDEREKRYKSALELSGCVEAFNRVKSVQVMGHYGSKLRRLTTDVHDTLHMQAHVSTLPPQIQAAVKNPRMQHFLLQSQRFRSFGKHHTKTEAQSELSEQLPASYQTTAGLQAELKRLLHVTPNKVSSHLKGKRLLTENEFNQKFDWNKPFYGFETDMQALLQARSLEVVHLLEHSPAMRKALGIRGRPTTIQLMKKAVSLNLEHVHNTLDDYMKQVDEHLPAANVLKQPRFESIEGRLSKLYIEIQKHIRSWFSVGHLLPDFIQNTFHHNPDLDDLLKKSSYWNELSTNDRLVLEKAYPAETERMLLLQFLIKREHETNHSQSSVVSKALEQYALVHANEWAKGRQHALFHRLSSELNRMQAEIGTMRPTFDWRVAAFELCDTTLNGSKKKIRQWFQQEPVQLLFAPVRSQASRESWFEKLSKFGDEVLQSIPDAMLFGDNPEYWKNTRTDVNIRHTGYSMPRAKDNGYPFLRRPRWLG